MLGSLLLLRGALNVLFALYLFASPELDRLRLFRDFSYVAIADGVLALLTAGLLLRASRSGSAKPAGLAAFDALTRLGIGLAVLIWPGIPHSIVLTVLFVGILAAWALFRGVAGVALAIHEAQRQTRREAQHDAPRVAVGPLALAAAASFVFGVTLVVALKDTRLSSVRLLLACYTLALGAALLAAGWHRRRAPAL
jgi:uncharacterized membrane protein HdeD (DUF308 family)